MAELDLELQALRDAGAARGLPAMVTLTPDEARERVRAGDRLCAAGPTHVRVDDRLAVHDGMSVPVRTYTAEPGRGVTLVYAHGGGWVTGDLDYADELCRFLASDAGCDVVSVDYRLAPEHPYPAGIDDLLTAYRWAGARRPDALVAIGGDSAGGNLAAVCAQQLRTDPHPPAFQVLVYPVLDGRAESDSYRDNAAAFPIGAADMAWFLDHYVEPELRTDPRVSPLRAPDLTGLPPTLVVTAGHDPLRDEGVAYVHALLDAGVQTDHVHRPELCHGFLRFTAASAAAGDARDRLVDAVRRLVDMGPPRADINAYDSHITASARRPIEETT